MGKYLVVTFLFVLAISVPGRADTTQCITASVPTNNVTVGFDTSPSCGTGIDNLRIIRDIHADASGATETACDFPSELPTGWVITGFIAGSDCSRDAQSGVELYTIKNLNGLGTEDQEEVCYQSAVPLGWVIVNTQENTADCGGNGALGTHRGFFNVNGEPQNFVKTVCTISPIPAGWVAGSPMSDPTSVCGGGTSLVQITNTNPLITYAKVQANGNFAIFAKSQPTDTQKWSNGAASQNTTDLVIVQNDGNLVEYNQTFTTGTAQSPNGFNLSTGCLPSRLLMGQTINAGQCMASDSGRFVLALQTQGNLVLYDASPNPNPWIPLWEAGNNVMGGAYAVMQTAGNFVLYNANGVALWWTTASSPGPGFLWLQDDGNLNVYTAIWSTGTFNQPPGSPVLSAPCNVGELLSTATGGNPTLNDGQCLLSPNSRFELSMQSSGNLVLYDLSQNPARQLWSVP